MHLTPVGNTRCSRITCRSSYQTCADKSCSLFFYQSLFARTKRGLGEKAKARGKNDRTNCSAIINRSVKKEEKGVRGGRWKTKNKLGKRVNKKRRSSSSVLLTSKRSSGCELCQSGYKICDEGPVAPSPPFVINIKRHRNRTPGPYEYLRLT